MEQRTVVVTGASSGVGLAAARQFAALGDRVVVVGRDPDRLAAAVEQVHAAAREAGNGAGGTAPDSFRADFERLDDVRALAEHLIGRYPAIDVLANNAGTMHRGYHRTVDGFEATIQANHLAPYLLTGLLRDRLRGGRVVNTASDAHRMGRPGTDFSSPAGYNSWRTYGQSKAANILFAAEAARRWPDILSVSFHPGIVRSNFGTGRVIRLYYRYAPLLTSPEKAGALLVWLAGAPTDQLTRGAYYVGRTPKAPARAATDPDTAARLWETSATAVGLK